MLSVFPINQSVLELEEPLDDEPEPLEVPPEDVPPEEDPEPPPTVLPPGRVRLAPFVEKTTLPSVSVR